MAPFALGVNVTSNVQVAPEATVTPQGVAPEGVAAKSPLATRLEIVSVPLELLVSVTVLDALVVPTPCAVNVKLVGDSDAGISPVPETPMICGLPGPEVAMATDPFTAPVAEGVKVTDSVHLADVASAPPQGVVPFPPAAKFPLALIPEIVIVPVLLFVTVRILAALVAPIPVTLNVNAAGLIDSGTVGPPVAAPLRLTVSGLNAAPELMSSAPLIVPLYCGVKVTVTVQLLPPASEPAHVPPVTE